jgi:chitin disaccharide deacetylase
MLKDKDPARNWKERTKPISARLIVNADDYGHTPGVSAGIRDSHLHGIVTSTTAMMNMPGVEAALHKALQDCPRMGLGVHLVLTTGAPVSPVSQVPSLISGGDRFAPASALIPRLSALDPKEVQAEWRAQVDKFFSITGRTPDHLDSHHHVSFVSSDLFRIMLELAQTYTCAIRFPNGEAAVDMMCDFPPETARACLEAHLHLVDQYRPRRPDHLITSFYGEGATCSGLVDLLENLPNGTTEIMCHPGYADEGLMNSSDYQQQRESELSILTDHEVMECVKEKNIELINFGDLSPAGHSMEKPAPLQQSRNELSA